MNGRCKTILPSFPFQSNAMKFGIDQFQQQNLMSNNSSLVEWLNKLGISKQLNNNDILSGIAINATLAKIINNYTVRLSSTNTASSRINNWNTVINELEKIGVRVGQQQKSKILNGDDKIVYNILYELKAHYDKNREEVEVDINKIDARGDPKTAKSLLELFILVIIKYYGFSVKEAVALLSNDSKYLAHILAKGFKENPKPVQSMLLEFERLLPQISLFCKNKENETFFLKSIKPGLISKYLSISELSLELLTMFTKNATEKYEIVKNELMSTLVLCLRRHSCQIGPIIRALTQMVGYNKNLLTLFMAHGSAGEVAMLMIEMFNQCESDNQVSEIFQQFKIEELIQVSIENIKNSELFANAGVFLLKVIEHNYLSFMANSDNPARLVESLSSINISKRGDVMIYSNLLFAFLHLFGKKKNAIAPQLFKLAVDRYKSALNEDESHNYLFNFLQIIEIFPSIPTVGIAETILSRHENSISPIGQLEFDILLNSLQSIDQKLALRIYNTITKIFIEEIGSVESIANILETIIRKFDSKIIFDLTVKFIKVCLAVYYANLRKLNYSKSLIDGTIKFDKSNVFYKAKNNEIEKLLTSIILIRDEKLNKTLEPLICYSFIQSELKNKDESEGIKRVMIMLGEESELRKLYENDAKLMLEDVRNQGRKKSDSKQKNENPRYKEGEAKIRVSSDASLLVKKKDFHLSLSIPPKIALDAQKGLEKYTKVYLQKVGKQSLQEQKKAQDEERKQELRRRFTMKILQKGIKINNETTVNCIYEFNSKQKELQRDSANDFSYLPFYDPESEDDRDVKALQYLIKKYAKLFKVYYNNYGGKLRPNTIKLFEDISERGNLMQSANVWKLLRDHYLDEYITVNEVQFIVQKINAHLKKDYRDSSILDYEVFENFIIQVALAMFSRPPKDMRSHPISDMVHQIINKFKEHAQENRIGEKVFEQQEHFQTNKPEQLKELNEKLQQNPDYILPEGYKKHTTKKLLFDYKFYLHSLNQSHKDVYEVLDQILNENLGFHIIEPYSVTVVQATARPLLYQTQFDYSMKERSLSSIFPRESKFPKEVKEGEEENLGEEQSNVQLSRLENKFLREKRLKEDEKKLKEQQELKRRQQRDRQLKNLLEKHRQKQQQLQKDKEQKKNEEARKLQEQKKKRQKYEQDLKKKVSQYMQKKRTDKSNEELELRKKKQEQIKNMEKLKQDTEKKKRMVEQSKQKKKAEEDAKKQIELDEQKKRQEEDKIKLVQKKERTKKLLEEYKQRKQKEKDEEQAKVKQNQQQSPSKSNIKEPSLRSKLTSSKSSQKQKVVLTKDVTVEELDNTNEAN